MAKDTTTTTEKPKREESGLGSLKNVHALKCQLKAYLDSIGGITKDNTANAGGTYRFRGIDDLYNKMALRAAELGLDLDPKVTSKQIDYQTNAKGNVQTHLHITMDIEWTSAWDMSKTITTSIGEAIDTSDKCSGKAMSYAMKNGCFAALQIPTHGEPMDVESYNHQNGPPAQNQAPPMHSQQPAAQQEPPPKAKKEKGPGPAKVAPPPPPPATNGAPPFPNGDAPLPAPTDDEVIGRVGEIQTFPLLFAFAQDAQNAPEPLRQALFSAIKGRTIALFASAQTMNDVQHGVSLVNALGAPDDLKRACNEAYMRFR